MKIAVITGASSGMGRELALLLDQQIPNIQELWLIGRRRERLLSLERRLRKKCRLLSLDLLEPSSILSYERALEESGAEIVFLVNAAGFGKIGAVSRLSLSEQLAMIDLNLRSLTAFCRVSIPYLSEKSRIINFSSAAAFLPQPDFSVYAAGKSYVLSFSEALDEERRGSGCRVCAVCPGPVKTEFFDVAERDGQSIAAYKILFMARPDRVARLALRDSVLGKKCSVYGYSMKLFRLLAKLLPHSFFFFLLREIQRLSGSMDSNRTLSNKRRNP